MFKLICFMAPAVLTVWIKHYLEKSEYKLINAILEWLVFCIFINLMIVITMLPFGSVIITNCEEGHVHIQYGAAAIFMSSIYAIFIGIVSAFVSASKAQKKENSSGYN